MNKKKPKSAPEAAAFAQARDELFSHILRCGVIDALPEHQKDWFDDTMGYIADRYESLSEEEQTQLRLLGERYCQPVRRVDAVESGGPEPPEKLRKRPGHFGRGVFAFRASQRSEATASGTPASLALRRQPRSRRPIPSASQGGPRDRP
jgi:hypothetical protein